MGFVTGTQSPGELRQGIRAGDFTGQTAGQAPGYLQGNVVILPAPYAPDFLRYCMNNPKPCPLIGLTRPGVRALPGLGHDIDISTDVPKYRVYERGELVAQPNNISKLWADDFVTFVLGCSFSFEQALIAAGFGVRHIELGRNAAMFKTTIETIPGGIFKGPMVVTMRPFPAEQIPDVFDVCARFPLAHGTPIYWGDAKRIGISDLQSPDYGDALEVRPDEVPVFWACGVTPQAAIEAARPNLCITHAPGHMLVTDIPSDEHPVPDIHMAGLQQPGT